MEHLPSAKMAELIGVTQRRIQQLTKDGTLKKYEGLYNAYEAVPAYIQTMKRPARETAAADRLKAARAELAELDLARKRERYVDAEKLRADFESAAEKFRADLASIPARIAARHVDFQPIMPALREALGEAYDDMASECRSAIDAD